MDSISTNVARPRVASFAELFTPKLVTVLREGYALANLRADTLAGLTVAIVALPLSMAIAIASGVTPDRGLYTSIVGGFVVSALGGSRFQIGGPAGAFIVLVAATVHSTASTALILATLLSGVILLAIGFLRLGVFIKYIPYPVTVGFTSGIAVIIFASQIKDLLGLTLAGTEPGPSSLSSRRSARRCRRVNTAAVAVVAARDRRSSSRCAGCRPHWPGISDRVVARGLARRGCSPCPSRRIGTPLRRLPASLPLPASAGRSRSPKIAGGAARRPLLRAARRIESLLSAVVADSMTGRRHRSNASSSPRAWPIWRPPLSAASASPARSRAPRPMCAPARAAPSPACCIRSSCCCSCSWRRRSQATFRSRRSARCSPSSPGTWPRSTISRRCCAPRAVMRWCWWRLSCWWCSAISPRASLSASASARLLFLHRMAQATGIEVERRWSVGDRADDANGERAALRRQPGHRPGRRRLPHFRRVLLRRRATVAAALDRIGEHPKAFVIDFSACR